jgi:hypothetical protein
MAIKLRKEQNGFIALMSVIIVSMVLLLMVTTANFTGLYLRFGMLDTELKARSEAAADACVDQGLLWMAENKNISFPGTSIILNATDQCSIGEIATSSDANGHTLFTVQATSSSAVTNLQMTVDRSTLTIISRQELSTL